MANPNIKPNYGNKGGGRKGYQYEKDQLNRMRRIADRGLALIEAIMKGKVTKKEVEKYEVLEKSLLKIFDKLQANKQQVEHSGEIATPQPIMGGLSVSTNDSDQQNLST